MPLEADIQATFGTEPGERVLRYLMGSFWVWQSLPHPTDSNTLSFREGQRDVVLFLVRNMMDEKDKDALADWMREQLAATGYDKPVDSSLKHFLPEGDQ